MYHMLSSRKGINLYLQEMKMDLSRGNEKAIGVFVSGGETKQLGWIPKEIISEVACEYSRLSFAPATTCETRRQTSAIHRQKFHTDDVNLPALKWHN